MALFYIMISFFINKVSPSQGIYIFVFVFDGSTNLKICDVVMDIIEH